MKLTYRGVSYDAPTSTRPTTPDHPADGVTRAVLGQYRGVSTLIKLPLVIVRPAEAIGLLYRGAAYLKL